MYNVNDLSPYLILINSHVLYCEYVTSPTLVSTLVSYLISTAHYRNPTMCMISAKEPALMSGPGPVLPVRSGLLDAKNANSAVLLAS